MRQAASTSTVRQTGKFLIETENKLELSDFSNEQKEEDQQATIEVIGKIPTLSDQASGPSSDGELHLSADGS